jgi:hypothetical protein
MEFEFIIAMCLQLIKLVIKFTWQKHLHVTSRPIKHKPHSSINLPKLAYLGWKWYMQVLNTKKKLQFY